MKKTAFLLCLASIGSMYDAQNVAGQPGQEPVITVDGVDFYDWQDYTHSSMFLGRGLRCGILERETRLLTAPVFRNPNDCTYTLTNIQPQYEPDGGIVYEIPVVFHVISSANGTGNMGASRIHTQMEILNEDFRALAGTPGANGTDVRIQFYLATEDPSGNPTNGINRVTNNAWFQDSGNYWDSLAWDTNRYMNVYTNQASGALGYVPDLPQGNIAGQNFDRVVVLFSAIGRNAPIGPPFDQGRTLTHEVGHYLGLEHTFSGGCDAGGCYSSGDLICDTNPESSPTSGCPGNKQSCGSPDPITNYMDYSNDTCYQDFTPEQANRMRCSLENYRPNLARSICPAAASSSSRNGGANPDVFTATLPIVADTQTLTVSTSPYSFASIVGYAGSGSFALSGGQVALVDLGSAKLFQFNAVPGPTAEVSYSVPHDVGLCGVPFTMQAVLFGGATPFALTNAVDQVIGSTP